MATRLDNLIEQYRKAIGDQDIGPEMSPMQQALIQFAPAAIGGVVGALSKEPGGLAAGVGIGGEAGSKALSTMSQARESAKERKAKVGEKAFDLAMKQAQQEQESQFKRRELDIKEREAAGKQLAQDQKLPASQATEIGSIDAAEKQLFDIENSVAQNQEVMGPFMGRIATLSPYSSTARVFDAQMKIAAQNIGKSLEGGKLTDEDIRRYREMLPNLADTPDVAVGKIAQVRQLLSDRKRTQVEALRKAGYQTGRFETQDQVASMGDMLPPGMKVNLQRQGIPEAKPKTIRQNGVTFQLNEQTGEYTPVTGR
jgi:hypothetical protein